MGGRACLGLNEVWLALTCTCLALSSRALSILPFRCCNRRVRSSWRRDLLQRLAQRGKERASVQASVGGCDEASNLCKQAKTKLVA